MTLPVDNRVAVRSVELTGLHDDPADRIILATALTLGSRAVTGDPKLHCYAKIETVW